MFDTLAQSNTNTADIIRMYRESTLVPDRRQRDVTIDVNKRSGLDQRKKPRVLADQDITKQLEEVRQIYGKIDKYDQFARQQLFVQFQQKQDKSKQENEPSFKLNEKVETACRYVPPLRKAVSMFEGGQAGNWAYAIGMTYRFINEFKEDWHDVKSAIKGGEDPYVEYQHPFWATKESLIDEKFGKTKIVSKLKKYDYTLFDLKSVKKFLLKIGVTGWDEHDNCFKIHGNWYAQVIGRATLRIPLQGAALFMLMNSYAICKAEDKPKEILKSVIRMVCIMGMSAICGSITKPANKIPEMAFMGAGIIWGTQLANKINSKF